MTMLIIQSLLLMAIAYIIGCLLGGLLRHLFSPASQPEASKPEQVKKPTPEVKPAPAVKSVAKKPVPEAKPKPASEPVAQKPAPKQEFVSEQKDDLKRIRGIGPQNEARLNSIGIQSFAQIAAWSVDEQREIGERLAFPGRIEREGWVEQAATLDKGGETDFAKRVDKGEVESSLGEGTVGDVGKRPPAMESAPENGGDDLSLIDGVGAAIEKKLHSMGIYTFEQVSKWNQDQQSWIGNELGFPGRVERENWVAEAKKLAAGGAIEQPKKAKRGEIITRRKS